MPEQLTGLFGVVRARFLSYYGATLHTKTLSRGFRAILLFFWKGISPSEEGDQGAALDPLKGRAP